MATLKGLIDFEGTMGGINAYTLNGKRVLRQSRTSQKDKIKTRDNYQRTRENNMEFSGAVLAAKVLRLSLMSVARPFVDPGFTGTLQGKYTDMLQLASGKRGQRVFKPLLHAEAMLEIPFNKALHLDSILHIKPAITANAARTTAVLSISLNPQTDIYVPAGATHVQLIFAIAIQPSFEYDVHTNKYKRMDELDQPHMTHISSQLIPTDVNVTTSIVLPAPPFSIALLHAESALVSVLGICFHQQIGFKTYPLESGKAMAFVAVQ